MNDATPPHPDLDPDAELLARDFTIDTLITVRHDVERCAAKQGLTGVALYRFVVAVNELTTNAVRHGGGNGRLTLWRTSGWLHCRVIDEGPGLPVNFRHQQPPAHAVGGRGLWLAHHGAERLIIHSDANGTSITASTRL